MTGIDILDFQLQEAEAAIASGDASGAIVVMRMMTKTVRRWVDQQAAEQEAQREQWRVAKRTQPQAELAAPAQRGVTYWTGAQQLTMGGAILQQEAPRGRAASSNERKREELARMAFAYWQAVLDHPRAILDRQRMSRLTARLRENGDDLSELMYVVDGARRDDFLMGRDPRSNGRRYDGIETLFRNREQVERLASRCPGHEQGEIHHALQQLAASMGQDGPL